MKSEMLANLWFSLDIVRLPLCIFKLIELLATFALKMISPRVVNI